MNSMSRCCCVAIVSICFMTWFATLSIAKPSLRRGDSCNACGALVLVPAPDFGPPPKGSTRPLPRQPNDWSNAMTMATSKRVSTGVLVGNAASNNLLWSRT